MKNLLKISLLGMVFTSTNYLLTNNINNPSSLNEESQLPLEEELKQQIEKLPLNIRSEVIGAIVLGSIPEEDIWAMSREEVKNFFIHLGYVEGCLFSILESYDESVQRVIKYRADQVASKIGACQQTSRKPQCDAVLQSYVSENTTR